MVRVFVNSDPDAGKRRSQPKTTWWYREETTSDAYVVTSITCRGDISAASRTLVWLRHRLLT